MCRHRRRGQRLVVSGLVRDGGSPRTGGRCFGKGGHAVSGRESYLRACVCYSAAWHPLFGAPVDPRLLEAFHRQRAAFDKAAALMEPPGEQLTVAFDGTAMPRISSGRRGQTRRGRWWSRPADMTPRSMKGSSDKPCRRCGAATTACSSTGPARAPCCSSSGYRSGPIGSPSCTPSSMRSSTATASTPTASR